MINNIQNPFISQGIMPKQVSGTPVNFGHVSSQAKTAIGEKYGTAMGFQAPKQQGVGLSWMQSGPLGQEGAIRQKNAVLGANCFFTA